MLALFFFLTFAQAAPPAPIQTPNTLDQIELDILKKKYTEALGSLKDIPLSERNKKYESLVEKAAIGHIEALKGNLSEAERSAEDLPNAFPVLKKSEPFQTAWDTVTQEGFTQCFETGDDKNECGLRLYSRLEKNPERTELLLWAAKTLYKYGKGDLAFKSLSLGARSSKKARVCQSRKAIDLLVATMTGTSPRPEAMEFVKENCWGEIRFGLAREIARVKDPNFLDNACGIFDEKKTPHAKCRKRKKKP